MKILAKLVSILGLWFVRREWRELRARLSQVYKSHRIDHADSPPIHAQQLLISGEDHRFFDRLTQTLAGLAQQDPECVILVNSAGIVKKSDRANELHPKPAGFKKIAAQHWLPVLSEHGFALSSGLI